MIQTKLLQEPLFAHCGGGGVLIKMTLAIGMTAVMTMKMLVLIDWGR